MGALTFARILAAVAAQEGTTPEALRGPSVMGGYSEGNEPRHRALMLARRLLPTVSWHALAREMGRTSRNVTDQARLGEARYARDPDEQLKVLGVLARLGLGELPPYDDRQWRRAKLDGEIRRVEAQLAALRARRAELGEAA